MGAEHYAGSLNDIDEPAPANPAVSLSVEGNHLISAVVDAARIMMVVGFVEVAPEGDIFDAATYMVLVSVQGPSPRSIYAVHQRFLQLQRVALYALDGEIFVHLNTFADEGTPFSVFHLVRGYLCFDGFSRFAAAFQQQALTYVESACRSYFEPVAASCRIDGYPGQQQLVVGLGTGIGESDEFRCAPESIFLRDGIGMFHEDLRTALTASGSLQDDIVAIDGDRLVRVVL